MAESMCARLLHMGGDTVGSESTTKLRRAALAATLAADGSRRAATRRLIADFSSEDLSLSGRILVLDAISDAARILSNRAIGPAADAIAAGRTTEPSAGQGSVKDGTTEHVTKSVASAARVGDAGLPAGKTRRFASATKVLPSQPNRFAAEMRYFFFPLLASWQQPEAAVARWSLREPLITGPLLQCLGVLLECGGAACPQRDAVAAQCLDLVENFLAHGETYVRRCTLFLCSRVLLVGADDLLLAREALLDELHLAMRREGDETCRKMLGGLLAWIHQHD
eukprot:TRINITY_DN34519_c0_g1_i1.p1 TRINITY_DN34519_c0_g1~~TRINITY_DN34519_c0_g1_i1.p1  ORF type:complete len:290 (-),score=42.69 TRINITY_DN34519_c0_g1_i1:144-986(-)